MLELADRLLSRSRELGERVKRTPQERADLVRDTAWLLTAAARVIDASEYIPSNPEKVAASDRRALPDVFMRWHLAHVRNSRHQTYRRAADLALGRNRGAWEVDTRIQDTKPDELASRDDDGLAAVLAEIAALPRWGYRRRVK
ncbi:hypothetical protein ACTOWJ_01355 [Lysobacter sp. CA199]